MLFIKKLGRKSCQLRIAVMLFETAVNPSMGAFLKHPCFKHLKLHHRFSLLDLVTVNTLNSKVLAGSALKFNRGSSLLRVFEAWMPMRAYTEVLTATLGRLFPLLNWLTLNLCTSTANLCK